MLDHLTAAGYGFVSTESTTTWGRPGDDLAKGVADDGHTVTCVGPFTGTIGVGSTTLDAGPGADTLVAQRSTAGQVRWAITVSASTDLRAPLGALVQTMTIRASTRPAEPGGTDLWRRS